MLPLAHLIPCELLSDTGAGEARRVTLRCHEAYLPMPESGPGYVAFWPVESLPTSTDDLHWPELLAGPFHRGELILPRSSLFRTMMPEGQLVGFAVGDPFELNPESYEVDWVDAEDLVLQLTAPLDVSALLGPEPPPTPQLTLAPVDYELPSPLALESFAADAVKIQADHYRYECWSPLVWTAGYAEDPPPLPHLIEEGFTPDSVEEVLVANLSFIEGAVSRGQAQGLAWRSPTGSADDGALYLKLDALEPGRFHVRWLHYYLAGQAYTSLIPFDLKLEPTQRQRRWASNIPFPVLENP
ncbi:MAG: hypothetical protein ABI743_12560 [bacterium]